MRQAHREDTLSDAAKSLLGLIAFAIVFIALCSVNY